MGCEVNGDPVWDMSKEPYDARLGVEGTVSLDVEADLRWASPPEDGTTLIWLVSIRSTSAWLIVCFRDEAALAEDFCTRKLGLVVLVGLTGVTGTPLPSPSILGSSSASSDGPQWHFCLRGMAAVMAVLDAQEQGRDDGCGHELSGRPGFRTGTMRRSFACVHLVERWPRMHGSLQAPD